jgi:hypothetical protein
MLKLWLSSPVGVRPNNNEAQGAEQESRASRSGDEQIEHLFINWNRLRNRLRRGA